MLLCTCCGLPMTVCECWHTDLDEHRDNYEADYPYRYDPGYDWDETYDETDEWLVNAAETWRKQTQ